MSWLRRSTVLAAVLASCAFTAVSLLISIAIGWLASATLVGAALVLCQQQSSPLERARRRGANRLVYCAVRAIMRPIFAVGFRLERIGRDHIPARGPVILAANHRSVLDPVIVGLLQRRPVYYLAKQELFRKRRHAWLLGALGGFPIARGNGGDHEAMEVARRILERGDCLVIFPEGRCVPPGPLGEPRRGVGRLALATGAPVVPVAITGNEATNRHCIPPPRRIRVRVGPPLSFAPANQLPTRDAIEQATGRIWAAVTAQWRALDYTPRMDDASPKATSEATGTG